MYDQGYAAPNGSFVKMNFLCVKIYLIVLFIMLSYMIMSLRDQWIISLYANPPKVGPVLTALQLYTSAWPGILILAINMLIFWGLYWIRNTCTQHTKWMRTPDLEIQEIYRLPSDIGMNIFDGVFIQYMISDVSIFQVSICASDFEFWIGVNECWYKTFKLKLAYHIFIHWSLFKV